MLPTHKVKHLSPNPLLNLLPNDRIELGPGGSVHEGVSGLLVRVSGVDGERLELDLEVVDRVLEQLERSGPGVAEEVEVLVRGGEQRAAVLEARLGGQLLLRDELLEEGLKSAIDNGGERRIS